MNNSSLIGEFRPGSADHLVQSLVSRQVDEGEVTVFRNSNRGVRGQSKQGSNDVRFGAEEAAAIPENKHQKIKDGEISNIKYIYIYKYKVLCKVFYVIFSQGDPTFFIFPFLYITYCDDIPHICNVRHAHS